MKNKQTAVELLIEKLTELGVDLLSHNLEIQQAKAMEKEQIKDAYANGSNDRLKNTIKDYYNENYGN